MAAVAEMAAMGFVPYQVRERAAAQLFGQAPGRRLVDPVLFKNPDAITPPLANLRILEVEEIKSVPYAPISHPFVERLIGTILREYLDHTLFWNSVDLHRKLERFGAYYNGVRVHRSLNGITPANRAGNPSPSAANLAHYAWESHCFGLFETPVAA